MAIGADIGFQSRVRREAMTWLTVRTNDGLDAISTPDLDDFVDDGEPFLLKDRQQGIRKPLGWSAALSVQTVWRADGAERPYADEVGSDGLLRYKWRGDDPNHYVNVGLREAMRQQAPMIWFFGVGVARWQPVFPIYFVDEDQAQQQFIGAFDFARELLSSGSVIEENLRRYVVAETKRRLHQPVFRATVMRAYGIRCAVCSLAHSALLDAAHIIADGQDGGDPVVRNGLALCKIHHAAFDAGILGIRPDYQVEIRHDLLAEIDGPMLKHGLQELHRSQLRVLPAVRRERPDPERLDQAYQRFLAAG